MGKDFSNGGTLGRDLKSKEASHLVVWEKRAPQRRDNKGSAAGDCDALLRQWQKTVFCRALQVN